MNVKQVSISSYSDLQKLSPKIKIIHLRKFVSRKLLNSIIEICPDLELILVSQKVYSRSLSSIMSIPVRVRIIKRSSGRPNFIDKILINMGVNDIGSS